MFQIGVLSLANQGFGFSKVSGSIKSGIFSGGNFQNFIGFKIRSRFCSKSFGSNLLRLLKLASRFLAKVLASKRSYFTKFVFVACVSFGKIRFLKLATFFSAKVSVSFVQVFLSGSFFSGKVTS